MGRGRRRKIWLGTVRNDLKAFNLTDKTALNQT